MKANVVQNEACLGEARLVEGSKVLINLLFKLAYEKVVKKVRL